jgi:ribonuclease HI
MSDLYCDGGVIQVNPSPYGGTFSWVLIEDNQIVKEGCGIVPPIEVGLLTVSNNLMELYAALAGLVQMGEDWRGTLWTDSQVTFFRLGSSLKLNGIPREIRTQCLQIRRARRWQVNLLKGHPTRPMLRKGYVRNCYGKRVPVSKWNVYCDQKCQQLAKEFFEPKYPYELGL